MCGRYSIIADESAIYQSFKAKLVQPVPAHYNASPGQSLPVITNDNPAQVQLFRWGFIPDWAKDEKEGYKMINARADGIEEKTSFKKAVQKQHCLVLANSFFEWQQNSTSKTGKTPYRIRPTDQELFAMAGIWNRWTNYATGEIIHSFAIITTEANELMHGIHERMPVILPQDKALQWIEKQTDVKPQLNLLQPYAANEMEAFEVTREVNKTVNDYPQLLEPLGNPIRVQVGAAS